MKDTRHQHPILTGALLAVLATIIWSGNFVIARSAIKAIPPITLAFYRWLTATLILLPFAWKALRADAHFIKERPWYFLLAAITGVTLFNTFVYIAGHDTTAINMALIGTTTSPIISVILARIFLKEKITVPRIAGLIVCVIGVLVLLSGGKIRNLYTFSFSTGDWWMLASAFVFAVYNVTAKRKPAGMQHTSFLFTVFCAGTILLFPFYLFEWGQKGGIAIDAANLGSILYLGIGASVLSFLLWNLAIARLGAGRASLFGNLIPIFSSIEAVFLLNEKVRWVHGASFILVITGLLIANFSFNKKK